VNPNDSPPTSRGTSKKKKRVMFKLPEDEVAIYNREKE
jgi:hypothetical protein